ncbi:unnamed protein product, partial [Prunus brigantina]
LIISSDDGSRSPSLQESLYLWSGSKVHKNIFLANLHCVTSKAHFQKWCATYPCAILDDVHVKLAASSTDNEPCVDPNDSDARIITFCPFYFSLGFTFSLSKFFRKLSTDGGKARLAMVHLFLSLFAMRMISVRNWISSQTWLRSVRP